MKTGFDRINYNTTGLIQTSCTEMSTAHEIMANNILAKGDLAMKQSVWVQTRARISSSVMNPSGPMWRKKNTAV